MKWFSDRERQVVFADFTLDDDYCGYPGMAHGGVIGAVMDEIAGRAVMINDHSPDNLYVTAKMEIKYRQPTPTYQPLHAEGWVDKGGDGSRVVVKSEIRTADGTVTASCVCHMVKPPASFTNSKNMALVAGEWYLDE
ncbi:MAG: PaaI family thioesterase [Syntrophomonadaceae bacterium]|nr:PaaI family thioesterase [Syntrophomonadaceae bacterium]